MLLNPGAAHLPLEGRCCPNLAVSYKAWGGSLAGVWARLGANGQGRTSTPRSGVLGMLLGSQDSEIGSWVPYLPHISLEAAPCLWASAEPSRERGPLQRGWPVVWGRWKSRGLVSEGLSTAPGREQMNMVSRARLS